MVEAEIKTRIRSAMEQNLLAPSYSFTVKILPWLIVCRFRLGMDWVV